MLFIYNLPDEEERNKLSNLLVPFSSQTLGEVLVAGDNCITYAGLSVAKIIWQQCPDVTFDQLGAGVVPRENEIRLIPRINKEDKIKIQQNEKPLQTLYAERYGVSIQSNNFLTMHR